jgi:tripartite-type tricarboxylate transporter receptor subunit TctC
MKLHLFSTIGLAAAAGAALTGPAHAAPDFTGKQVLLIVASNEGKGTDIIGRFMARGMSKYLKGNPDVIVKNTGAGGGKIRGANLLAKAKPDGLTIMQSDGTTVQPTTLRRKSVRYDPTKFPAIGAINRGGSILFMRKEAVARLMDKSKKPAIIGAISGTRSWQAVPMWGAEFLGWNVKWIPGYKGNNQFSRAIRQAEIDAFATNSNYIIDPLIKEGVVTLLYQVGQPDDDGKYVARESFKQVPIFPNELRKKVKLTKLQWRAYLSLVNPSLIDKWMALPPNTPKEIVETWRSAYKQAFNDPELKQQLKKQFGDELTLISGKRVDEMIEEVSGVGDDVVDYTVKLKQKYGISAAR